MAEKWKLHDTARIMTQKFNAMVDELNEVVNNNATIEQNNTIAVDDLTDKEIDAILTIKEVKDNG